MISFLPGLLDGLCWSFAYRFRGFGTIPKMAMAGIGAAGKRTAGWWKAAVITNPIAEFGADRGWSSGWLVPAICAAVYTTQLARTVAGQLQIGHNVNSGFAAAGQHLYVGTFAESRWR
jgi:hypothetical protein